MYKLDTSMEALQQPYLKKLFAEVFPFTHFFVFLRLSR